MNHSSFNFFKQKSHLVFDDALRGEIILAFLKNLSASK